MIASDRGTGALTKKGQLPVKTASTDGLRLDSIDDYLGPGETRFFANGYRRVGQRLTDLAFEETGGMPGLRATASVHYPADWSKKRDGVHLPPHLSTIDALVFGARLAELQLAAAHGLGPRHRAALWLRRVDIRAGSAPVEEGFDALPASASLVGTRPSADSASPGQTSSGQTSTVDCRVGPMKVRLEVEHGAEHGAEHQTYATDDRPAPREPGPASPEESDPSPFQDGYRSRRQSVTGIEVAPDSRSSTASVLITTAGADGADATGLEAAYQPSVSMIDAFVVALQLGQTMLYELDQVARSQSNTLWMRRTVLESAAPRRSLNRPLDVTARLEQDLLVEARSGVWRTADIVSTCAGVHVKCAVTHRIP